MIKGLPDFSVQGLQKQIYITVRLCQISIAKVYAGSLFLNRCFLENV